MSDLVNLHEIYNENDGDYSLITEKQREVLDSFTEISKIFQKNDTYWEVIGIINFQDELVEEPQMFQVKPRKIETTIYERIE